MDEEKGIPDFAHLAPIQGGETIDGLRDGTIDQDVQWPCHNEMALIEPERGLMDICPGEYAAGQREA